MRPMTGLFAIERVRGTELATTASAIGRVPGRQLASTVCADCLVAS